MCGIRIESFIPKPVCNFLGMGGESPSILDSLLLYFTFSGPTLKIIHSLLYVKEKSLLSFFHCFYSKTMVLTQRWSRFSSSVAFFHLESFPVFFKIFILALRSQIFEGDPRWIGLNNSGQTTYLITVYSSCNWQEIIFHAAFFIVSSFSILRGEKWKANITTFCISMTWNWRWVAI